MKKYRIGKVYISATSPTNAKQRITKAVEDGVNDYICVSNVRTVAYANKNAEYREVMNRAFMCTPDGMPLVWMARLWGLKEVQRTVGPDLFVQMIGDNESGLKHYLLGDTEETLSAMKAKFSGSDTSNIVGTFSPPFCELDEYDFEGIARRINESGANIVWVSLRAPKQDYLAVRLLPYLDKKICIGVGAAFRFSLGQIKHPPKIFKKLGLTGLFWRKMDLAKIGWYFHHFFLLLEWGSEILLSRLCGEKCKD
ncbi:MAG: WecB/TagA/CpsF family glycosyltransferase [Bacteroidaceae bacterium]|nr:WecB/TagA/CpsF family glycosyltransferase [Bacteroidaceae bacterium]